MKIILLIALLANVFCQISNTYTLKANKKATTGWNEFNWSMFNVPQNEAIVQIDATISASGSIGFFEGAFGFLSGKSSWFQSNIKETIGSNTHTFTWKLGVSQSNAIDRNNVLKFGAWKVDCGSFNIDSITLTTGEPQEFKYKGKSNTFEPVTVSSCPTITKVNGGMSGHGFATRYWDCCKPSCSWSGNAGPGNEAKHCTVDNTVMNGNYDAKSICDGGPSMTCTSQIPFYAKGCDDMAFAFAAVPGGTSVCGHCYLLTFDGKGKYSTNENHGRIKGKKLLVLASNIGYDVAGGQFDIMIPGGGVGAFNGCADVFGTDLGATYGGFLADCINDGRLGDSMIQCLTEKCNSVFKNHADGLEGCLFHVKFLEGADNPSLDYYEVECPSFLKEKY